MSISLQNTSADITDFETDFETDFADQLALSREAQGPAVP